MPCGLPGWSVHSVMPRVKSWHACCCSYCSAHHQAELTLMPNTARLFSAHCSRISRREHAPLFLCNATFTFTDLSAATVGGELLS